MKKFLNKLERKYYKYAIPNLTLILIALYVIGYFLAFAVPGIEEHMTLEPALILKGEIWRILTWLIIPPTYASGGLIDTLFTLIMLFFYFSIGTTLERFWGSFRYNVYIFGGLIITFLTSFITYGLFRVIGGYEVLFVGSFSTYYVLLSIFLSYAATFPEARVYLYFVIPLKVKWLGILYAAFLAYDCVECIRNAVMFGPVYLAPMIAIIASVLNFLIFFAWLKKPIRLSPEQRKMRQEFRKAMEEQKRQYAANVERTRERVKTRHRCEVCGRTELDDPSLEFRFCSKCDGNHEYCMEHLYTHEHVREN